MYWEFIEKIVFGIFVTALQKGPLKIKADGFFWPGSTTMVIISSYYEIFCEDLPLVLVSNTIMKTGRQTQFGSVHLQDYCGFFFPRKQVQCPFRTKMKCFFSLE